VTTGARSSADSHARAERLLAAGRNLYLAGFMGTGKSSAARALARILAAPRVDLDEAIGQAEGMSVARIFAERGERAFRAAEHRALKAAVAAGGSVVALGGGAVCFARNREVLRGTGPVVVLKIGRAHV
jgi:shikimate kinase